MYNLWFMQHLKATLKAILVLRQAVLIQFEGGGIGN